MTEYNSLNINLEENSNLDVDWYIDRTPEIDINNHGYNYFRTIINILEPTILFLNEMTVICEPLEISEKQQDCCICMEIREKDEICLVNCGHSFCGECIKNTYNKNRNLGCPLCRESIFVITTQKTEIKEQIDGLI
jgi:hypothetical protein